MDDLMAELAAAELALQDALVEEAMAQRRLYLCTAASVGAYAGMVAEYRIKVQKAQFGWVRAYAATR